MVKKKRKVHEAIGCIGFILILLGGAGMDSESILIPVAMTFAGLLMLHSGIWCS